MWPRVLCTCAAAAALGLAVVGATRATTGTLPGGTSFEVTVTAPADGATLRASVPYTVAGRATIGASTPVANTFLITAIDVSGSTSTSVSLPTCGNQNRLHDNIANTVLDCELAAAKALNDEAVSQGTVASVGLIGFAGRVAGSSLPLTNEAMALDLGPAADSQTSVAPAADANGNGLRDVSEVFRSAYNRNVPGTFDFPAGDLGTGFTNFGVFTSPGNTNYYAAVTQIRNLAATESSSLAKVAVILSDGDSTVGGPDGEHVDVALAGITGIRIFTFAIGNSASCGGSPGNFGTLQEIADATDATCTQLAQPANAADVVPGVIASQISAPKINGAGTFDSPETTSARVPFTGPGSLNFSRTYPASAATPGTRAVCARATGSDGGGSQALDACVNITFKAAPTITLSGGEPAGEVNEGSPFPAGGVVDGATSTTWTSSGGTGTCTFADPTSVNTSVTCDDDGLYTLTLTAGDEVNPPVSASEHLLVHNVAPTLQILPPSVGDLNVLLQAQVGDAGANDTLTCTIDWGDGSSSMSGPLAGVCTASHAYAPGPATRTIIVTATDDDAGSTARQVTVTLNRPPACTAQALPNRLWPPTHKYVSIALDGATDPDGDAIAYSITSVTQDEQLNGTGDGDEAPDARRVSGNGKLDLRAERKSNGDGRVYTIGYTAADGRGGSCAGAAKVGVPHSQNRAPVDTLSVSVNSFG